jgi:hypothetical protein
VVNKKALGPESKGTGAGDGTRTRDAPLGRKKRLCAVREAAILGLLAMSPKRCARKKGVKIGSLHSRVSRHLNGLRRMPGPPIAGLTQRRDRAEKAALSAPELRRHVENAAGIELATLGSRRLFQYGFPPSHTVSRPSCV